MGHTREKKQSKRSLKAQQQAGENFNLTSTLANLDISSPSPSSSSSLPSPSQLSIPTPSSRSSRSIKSQSSRATLSSTTFPATDTDTDNPDPPQSAEEGIEDIYDRTLLEIRQTPTKGFSVFTTRRISPGTLVLAETPLIRITGADEAASETQADNALHAAFNALPRAQQKQFRALHDSEKAGFTPVKSIYYSNCYNLNSRSTEGGSCIGLLASRINHSCTPNVQFSYCDRTGRMLFYAIKGIARGKEVVGTYDTVFEGRRERQRKQVMYYGFRCDCKACVGVGEFWGASDERRGELVRLRKEVKTAEGRWEDTEGGMGVEEVQGVVEGLRRMGQVMIKEGLMGDCLANVYRSAAKWASRAGDTVGEREWKVKQREVLVNCGGRNSARVLALDRTM